MSRSREERIERARQLGMTPPAFAAYINELREDYHQALFSPSRLLSRLVQAGGWPF